MQCEFPFKYQNETYYGCIDFIYHNGQKDPVKPWCSTKVRGSDRKHMFGGQHYGDCDSSCESAEEANRLLGKEHFDTS